MFVKVNKRAKVRSTQTMVKTGPSLSNFGAIPFLLEKLVTACDCSRLYQEFTSKHSRINAQLPGARTDRKFTSLYQKATQEKIRRNYAGTDLMPYARLDEENRFTIACRVGSP
jgi:hypothetical protein